MIQSDKMSALEWRATLGLAVIFGLRLVGIFVILPVFALYAERLPGGADHTLIGIAIGAYGLTQAILQIPFGALSDRYGRKPVIYAGLVVFAGGSFIAAVANDIYIIILGRMIQGAGAIFAAVLALAADLTREQNRTAAMAVIGSSIGLTFALSLVAGPWLNSLIGVPGIFAMTGVLALVAIGVVAHLIPDPGAPRFHSDAELESGKLLNVLRNPELARLNYGVFALHAALMAVFVVVPFSLREAGLPADQHWHAYLPVMVGSLLLMLPAVVYGERRGKLKPVLAAAVIVLLAGELLLAALSDSLLTIGLALLVFFTAFNLMEAMLPSLVSKIAPAGTKGTAIGVYSSIQFFGLFLGAALGGWISQHYGSMGVFAFCALLTVVWLIVAATMKPPAAVLTKIYPLPTMDDFRARGLAEQLNQLPGVREVLVLAGEGVAYLKVDMRGFDECNVMRVIGDG
jgi:MFS family permease